MRTIIAATACLTLLAACSDGGADADGDGTITNEEMAAEAASGGDIAMRPGQWEHTIEFTDFDMPGLPENMKGTMSQHMGQKVTTTSCMTQEEAERPNADFFGGQDNEDCTYEEFDVSGGNMTLRMTCKAGEGGTAKVAMDGEFGAESFTLTMDNQVSGTPAGDMSMKGTVTGRRIGDCPT